MARSYKKKNYVKDNGTKRKKFYQKLSHSRVRMETKLKIKNEDYDNIRMGKELTNPWDVIDWKWYYSDFELKEKFRYMTLKNEYYQICGEDWLYYWYNYRWYPRVKWFKGKYRLLK